MNKTMSKFQIITLAIFIIFIVVGVASFALYKGNSQNTTLPAITVWGTFSADIFNQYVSDTNNRLAQTMTIAYVQKKPENFSRDFVNALSIGQGPDVILVSSDLLIPQSNKLTLIPYSALPQRTFMDSYIQEANIYLSDGGILALPFTVDPLVMYWNRDMFNAASIATYPKYWDEFTGTSLKPSLAQKLTVKDENGNIRKSAIAMGDFSNIINARELLGSLILQSNNPVTIKTGAGTASSAIYSASSGNISPALKFFSQFVDPSDANYSWNRSMPADKTSFLAGSLATYFGFASELSDIKSKNPNLNFDVALLPQLRSGGVKATYGKMFGFSIVRASTNANTAYQIIATLTSASYLPNLSSKMYLPTVRTDIIAQGSNDPYITILNQAALVGKTWFDVDPASSKQIFATMVQAVTSGKSTVDQAVRNAHDNYDVILRQAGQ